MHIFQAVLTLIGETTQDNKRLYTVLANYVKTGGTLILISDYCLNASRSSHSTLNAEFALEGHCISRTSRCYVLNPNFENIFGPSIFASLNEIICTNIQLVRVSPDSAKIYRSPRELGTDCAATFVKRGMGFIGYLADTPEVPAAQTLLLAMLGRLEFGSWSFK